MNPDARRSLLLYVPLVPVHLILVISIDRCYIFGSSKMNNTHLNCAFRFIFSFAVFASLAAASSIGSIRELDFDTVSGINNAGQIVGTTTTLFLGEYPTSQAFVTNGGEVTMLALAPWLPSEGDVINNLGEVAGWSSPPYAPDTIEPFLYSNGTVTDLGKPGALANHAVVPSAINDSGQIVMTVYARADQNQGPTAYLNSAGVYSSLGTLGGSQSTAGDINNAGQAVGMASLAGDSAWHAFLSVNGAMTDLGTLGGTSSAASGINDSGQIVGSSSLSSDSSSHAFLYSGGVMKDLGTLGGAISSASGINNAGVIVGSSTTASGSSTPFVYYGGIMTDLNSLLPANSGWQLSYVAQINDSNQVVGYGSFNGQQHYFLLDLSLTETPEPTTALLICGGIAGIAVLRRRIV